MNSGKMMNIPGIQSKTSALEINRGRETTDLVTKNQRKDHGYCWDSYSQVDRWLSLKSVGKGIGVGQCKEPN